MKGEKSENIEEAVVLRRHNTELAARGLRGWQKDIRRWLVKTGGEDQYEKWASLRVARKVVELVKLSVLQMLLAF